MVGWFRRVRLPPPSAGLGPFSSASAFLSLPLSGFAHCGLGVLVLVFSLPSFPLLRSASRVPVKQFFQLIFMPISFSFSFHPHLHLMVGALIFPTLLREGVCV